MGFRLGGKTVVPGISDDMDPKGREYFKIGRTTGLTIGAYSHIEAYVETPMPSNSLNTKPSNRITSEKVIVGRDQSAFSDAGDFGAWILNQNGYLAGLIWSVNIKFGHCYYTPIDIIVADIEKQTGWKVEMYR